MWGACSRDIMCNLPHSIHFFATPPLPWHQSDNNVSWPPPSAHPAGLFLAPPSPPINDTQHTLTHTPNRSHDLHPYTYNVGPLGVLARVRVLESTHAARARARRGRFTRTDSARNAHTAHSQMRPKTKHSTATQLLSLSASYLSLSPGTRALAFFSSFFFFLQQQKRPSFPI
jgi:hypothetical protein